MSYRRPVRVLVHASLQGLAALSALALVSVLALLIWVRGSLPPLDGVDRLDGLYAEVRLERDARGRLTVQASSRQDLAFGLGYAHGQDRFFQMDLLRRAGTGTLAALLGPAAVRADQGARRHDLAGTALAALARTDPDQRALLESYARGVNAGLASLRARPWEYGLLSQTPEPWRALDSYHVALAMFRDLQDETNAHERALDLASRVLDPSVFALLTARPGPWEAPVEGVSGPWPRAQIPPSGPGRPSGGIATDGVMEDAPPLPEPRLTGSNSFAVGGAHTADGRAILANDMHLRIGLPPIWYATRLRRTGDEPLDAVGVTLPGAPGLVVGSNGHIAWGFTNSDADWLDHVVLDLDPRDPSRYRTADGWRRLTRRLESIEVAGDDPVELEVTESIWGPVVGRDSEGRPLALRWVAQDAEALNLHLIDLVELKTVEEALDHAPRCGVPGQNLLVAGRTGEIGWTIMGRVPRRVGLDGPRPRIWADGRAGWFGWLDAHEVPRIQPGREARLWTANARVVSLDEQRLLGDGGYDLGARARRIRDRLFERERFDETALFSIQLDTRAELLELWYQRLHELVTEQTGLPERERLLDLLEDWTGEASVESVAYRLVRDWRTQVARVVLGALGAPLRRLDAKNRIADIPRVEIALWAILRDRPDWIPAGYPDWAALERDSLLRVLDQWGDPEQWQARTWGARNTTSVTHPLSAVLPEWLRARLDLPARAVPGDSNLPRVATPTAGASERLVVAPGAEERGILHLPGGANPHPFSQSRSGDYEEWVAGEPVPLWPGPTLHTRVLEPADGG